MRLTSNALVLQGDQAVCSYAAFHNKQNRLRKNEQYQVGNTFPWAKFNTKGFMPLFDRFV